MTAAPGKVLLDTNLLLLWLVAETDATLLLNFKRVAQFRYADIQMLRDLLKPYRAHITTPHVLTETSNFVDQAPPHKRTQLVSQLRRFIDTVAEVYSPAQTLVQRGEFAALGLSDTGITELSSEAVVLTTDFHLSGRIESLGGYVLNFNHYRSSDLAG